MKVEGFVTLEDCLNRYLDYVDRMDRKKTRQSYTSHVKILRDFIGTLVVPLKFVYQFDAAFCNAFLDWIFLDKR